MDKSRDDVIVASIEALKAGQFKATGIKVELEAQLDRGREYCGSCDDGRMYCPNCDGNEYIDCDERCDEGAIQCDACDGSGTIDEDGEVACTECDDGYNACPNSLCEEGRVYCTNEECQDGRVDCEDCNGGSGNWGSSQSCHDFLLERLVPLGLAEEIPEGEGYGYAHNYRPKHPLVFSKFYNDGSVDSEWTFTLALDDPQMVMKLPEFINAFKGLADEIGGSFEVGGAGMHMALINSEGATYPTDPTDEQRHVYFPNFVKSMSLLLPALYFLGSCNETSRGLRYRRPQIAAGGGDNKYSAVAYRGGALEFRVFDTCYDNPDIILDNLVVIRNCMKYWRRTYLNPGLSKITKSCYFGVDGDNTLQRFYCRKEHISLLNKGLKLIKPAYYTVREVKRQRNFGVTQATINRTERRRRKEVENEYKEYEQRFSWQLVIKRNYHMSTLSERHMYNNLVPGEDMQKILHDIEKQADELIQKDAEAKQPLDTYVTARLDEINRKQRGSYRLAG